MRIRTLKPEWLDDEKLNDCSDAARVLSAGLILLADDHGRGRAGIGYIAGHVWSSDLEQDPPETLAKCSRALAELSGIDFASVYVVDRQRYFEIRNWSKHQRVDKPSKPRIPAPLPGSRVILAKPSRDIRETLAPDRDLDHGPGSGPGEDRGAGASAPEPSQSELELTNQDPPKPAPAETEPAPEKPIHVGWRVWRELWGQQYRARYSDAGPDGKVMKSVVSAAGRHARDHLTELENDGYDTQQGDGLRILEAVLRHWFSSYLADPGFKDYLFEQRHKLQFVEKDLPKYGLPWSQPQPPPVRSTDDSDRPEQVRLKDKRAAAAGGT